VAGYDPARLHTPPTAIAMLERLERRPEKGITVFDRRGRNPVERAYPEVARRARAWAAWFRGQGVEPGQVVFLCLQTSPDLIEAFLGLMAIRALPCMVALPRAIGGLDVFRRRLVKLSERFPGGQLLTTAEVGPEAGIPFWTVPDDLEAAGAVDLEPVDPAALAYVQLTSGSTTTPKAVAISHANLAANARGIIVAGEGHPDEDYVSWLPLYHDMGLVGMLFTALFHGVGVVLMPPDTFVGTPLKWLSAIAARDATVVTTAPNFGYQWCVDRIAPGKEEGLDLSNWRLALCGAEMVRPKTLEEFAARFGPVGFDPGAFLPCYGLAETTLAVTMCPVGRGAHLHEGRVSCGPPVDGLEVEVRAPGAGDALPDGREGEVVVRGTSVFQGYHLDPEATAAALRPEGLRTGDLGYLHAGELYVTGRVKDLLVLDGANVAPYELEWLAQEHIPLAGGRAAAFSVERESRERPVLVVEVKDVPAADALEALRAQVGRELAPLHDLVLVRRGTLPKTSSGKVQRGKVRDLYEGDALEAVLWRHLAEARSE